MDFETRFNVYLRQTNREKKYHRPDLWVDVLTPKQRRRINKKDNREWKLSKNQ